MNWYNSNKFLEALDSDLWIWLHTHKTAEKGLLVDHFSKYQRILSHLRLCQQLRKGPLCEPTPLHSIPLVSEPFCQIAIGITGPLPVCKDSGNCFIFTTLDLCTHFREAIPLKQHTAQEKRWHSVKHLFLPCRFFCRKLHLGYRHNCDCCGMPGQSPGVRGLSIIVGGWFYWEGVCTRVRGTLRNGMHGVCCSALNRSDTINVIFIKLY